MIDHLDKKIIQRRCQLRLSKVMRSIRKDDKLLIRDHLRWVMKRMTSMGIDWGHRLMRGRNSQSTVDAVTCEQLNDSTQGG